MAANILSICRQIGRIADEDFETLELIAKEQLEYSHPLKMATVSKQHKLGEHNMNVITKLRDLREVIRSGK